MSTLADLQAAQAATDVKIATIKTDVEALLTKLDNIPTGGLTPAQQAALDDAVAHANKINDSLSALDTEATAVKPTLTSIAPATGALVGGDSVVLTGSGFTGTIGVTIGGNPVASFSVVNDTTINAVTPAGTGGVAVVVTNARGASDGAVIFTYA